MNCGIARRFLGVNKWLWAWRNALFSITVGELVERFRVNIKLQAI
jgi:hypothetical protein